MSLHTFTNLQLLQIQLNRFDCEFKYFIVSLIITYSGYYSNSNRTYIIVKLQNPGVYEIYNPKGPELWHTSKARMLLSA